MEIIDRLSPALQTFDSQSLHFLGEIFLSNRLFFNKLFDKLRNSRFDLYEKRKSKAAKEMSTEPDICEVIHIREG